MAIEAVSGMAAGGDDGATMRADAAPPRTPSAYGTPYAALYLHIPFCAKRCGYCDFVTEAINPENPRLDDYVEGLIRDIRAAAREGALAKIETVYLGGGTPSFLGSRRLVNLVYTLSLSLNLSPTTEFTLEANPESLAPALVRDLYSLGVNRFSLGVQSFLNLELAALGRIHDARTARAALAAIRERTENVSVDLMCGLPLQSAASWRQSLAEALRGGASHISVYPLTIEDGTPFARAVAEGRQPPPDEDAQAVMMQDAQELLTAAGFKRYEVASYAREGFECHHNIAYWTGVPYLGFGTGAAGMRTLADGSRERLYNGEIVECLSHAEAVLEDLMLGMRMSAGISQAAVRHAATLVPHILDTFEELRALDLVTLSEGRFRPTTRGWLLGNELYGRIWDSDHRDAP
jgi:oxygen-independent coproporphyrinogen-3 oxidase